MPTDLPAMIEKQLSKLSASPLAPGLYIVSTPIGNLADITIRALSVLSAADLLLCEDTRHSRKLLSAFGIRRKLEAYHDFSGERDRARVLTALSEGKSVALISDAGTPLIADPGFKLVRSAGENGHHVFAIPGPSALLAGLVCSGFPTDAFLFAGFLPAKRGLRQRVLRKLTTSNETAVFYDTGVRLPDTLRAIDEILGDRPVVVARELTKLHEGVLRGSARAILASLRDEHSRGELVLLIGQAEAAEASEGEIEQALRRVMASRSLKEAVDEVTKELGARRTAVYNLALKLRDESYGKE